MGDKVMSNFTSVIIKSFLGGKTVGITDPDGDGIGGLDIYIQDQYTRLINLLLTLPNGSTTLQAPVTSGEFDIQVPTGLITVGDVVSLQAIGKFSQGVAVIVSIGAPNDTVTLGKPFDESFESGAAVDYNSAALNVDGSVTRQYATIGPPPGVSWDIVYWAILITDNTVMDSSTFGGIPGGLTRGVVLCQSGARNYTLGAARTNGAIDLVADLNYLDKVPAGEYGMIAEGNLSVRTGVTVRLDGDTNDKLELIIQDDLTSLLSMTGFAQGHVVE
jgi:hypothetical protein